MDSCGKDFIRKSVREGSVFGRCGCVFNMRLWAFVKVGDMIKLVSGSSYVKLSKSLIEIEGAINEILAFYTASY